MVEEKTQQQQEIEKGYSERIVRILSKDIEGNTKILAGLTKIKGISWSFANAVCKVLKVDISRKIGSLTPEEIKTISDFVKNPKVPVFILNGRFDLTTGEDHHFVGTDLEQKNEFDIKRLKKMKSYRGIRHVANLPVRGQRTRSNFRANRKRGVGIKNKGKKNEEQKKEFVKK